MINKVCTPTNLKEILFQFIERDLSNIECEYIYRVTFYKVIETMHIFVSKAFEFDIYMYMFLFVIDFTFAISCTLISMWKL